MPALQVLRHGFYTPADHLVPFGKLDDTVAQGRDPDDRVIRPGRVANKVEQVPSRARLVWDGPRVAEVPPDIDKLQAGNGIPRFAAHQLQIRGNDLEQIGMSRGFW